MNTKICITGISGYIGSYLAKFFCEQKKFDICGCDKRELPSYIADLPIDFKKLDLCDREACLSYFRDAQPDYVIHLGAYVEVGESEKDPLKYYSNNIVSTLNVLEAIKENSIKFMTFASTAAVYGEQPAKNDVSDPATDPTQDGFVSEINKLNPSCVYGSTKLCCEQIIQDASRVYGFNCVIFRFFNVAGGKIPPHAVHLFPILFESITNTKNLKIYGDDYSTPDGTCIRDYISIKDLALAHKKAIDWYLSNQLGNNKSKLEIINLGTCHGYSVKEVIRCFFRHMNKQVPVDVIERRPGDTAVLVASNQKANKVLNWKPTEDIDLLIENFIKDNN